MACSASVTLFFFIVLLVGLQSNVITSSIIIGFSIIIASGIIDFSVVIFCDWAWLCQQNINTWRNNIEFYLAVGGRPAGTESSHAANIACYIYWTKWFFWKILRKIIVVGILRVIRHWSIILTSPSRDTIFSLYFGLDMDFRECRIGSIIAGSKVYHHIQLILDEFVNYFHTFAIAWVLNIPLLFLHKKFVQIVVDIFPSVTMYSNPVISVWGSKKICEINSYSWIILP